MTAQVTTARKRLRKMSAAELDELIEAAVGWFEYDQDAEIMAEVAKVKRPGAGISRKVEFILGGDPIAAAGGLIDFLIAQKVLEGAL